MSAAQLSERARSLILAQIKANIAAELSAIRTDRDDPSVTTEAPKSYFIYEGAKAYQLPAIFLVVDSITFQDKTNGPNFVDALATVFVTVVVDAQEAVAITIRAERYQAALFNILHRTEYVDTDDNIKLYSRVLNCRFSPIYVPDPPKDQMGKFRKEVSLELEINHWENPTV